MHERKFFDCSQSWIRLLFVVLQKDFQTFSQLNRVRVGVIPFSKF